MAWCKPSRQAEPLVPFAACFSQQQHAHYMAWFLSTAAWLSGSFAAWLLNSNHGWVALNSSMRTSWLGSSQ
eukprot:1160694-Pelagomonas_calceolata.AAC.8